MNHRDLVTDCRRRCVLATRGLLSLVFLVATGVVLSSQSPKSVWDGVYTDEQATRGEALYRTHCAECHAESLTGQEQAPALLGISFSSTWEGTPLSDLFERMRTSMPEDQPGTLSRQQNADILAHMLRTAEFPAGATPLSGDARLLERIRYTTARP
jgi:mono/diheme cytochrome c family protein